MRHGNLCPVPDRPQPWRILPVDANSFGKIAPYANVENAAVNLDPGGGNACEMGGCLRAGHQEEKRKDPLHAVTIRSQR